VGKKNLTMDSTEGVKCEKRLCHSCWKLHPDLWVLAAYTTQFYCPALSIYLLQKSKKVSMPGYDYIYLPLSFDITS